MIVLFVRDVVEFAVEVGVGEHDVSCLVHVSKPNLKLLFRPWWGVIRRALRLTRAADKRLPWGIADLDRVDRSEHVIRVEEWRRAFCQIVMRVKHGRFPHIEYIVDVRFRHLVSAVNEIGELELNSVLERKPIVARLVVGWG